MPPALSNAVGYKPPLNLLILLLTLQMTIKRIHREVADVKKEDLGCITLSPSTDNLFHWAGTIPGPQGSPYEGGVFNIDIRLANDYP